MTLNFSITTAHPDTGEDLTSELRVYPDDNSFCVQDPYDGRFYYGVVFLRPKVEFGWLSSGVDISFMDCVEGHFGDAERKQIADFLNERALSGK